MNFYVGQRVVCVDDGDHTRYASAKLLSKHRLSGGMNGLTRGRVYTIRAVRQDWADENITVVFLREIVRPLFPSEPEESGYAPQRFRPLVERKTSIEIFQRLLLPSEKEKELETMTGNPNL